MPRLCLVVSTPCPTPLTKSYSVYLNCFLKCIYNIWEYCWAWKPKNNNQLFKILGKKKAVSPISKINIVTRGSVTINGGTASTSNYSAIANSNTLQFTTARSCLCRHTHRRKCDLISLLLFLQNKERRLTKADDSLMRHQASHVHFRTIPFMS
jgi:hypothetical protein